MLKFVKFSHTACPSTVIICAERMAHGRLVYLAPFVVGGGHWPPGINTPCLSDLMVVLLHA